MSMIRRSSPVGELLSLRQAMDRLFEDSYVRPGRWAQEEHVALPLDVYTTQDALVVEAALPGVKPEDVEVNVLGDTLTISGSTAQERSGDDEGYAYREIRRGSFARSVALPADVDADRASASFENGMLRLSIPRAERAKPRQIRIGTGGAQSGSGALDQSTTQDSANAPLRPESSTGQADQNAG